MPRPVWGRVAFSCCCACRLTVALGHSEQTARRLQDFCRNSPSGLQDSAF
ncbi:hypothetical protein ZHAS_00016123 [Anopheles sinensis]|uniref:Uncharacterized protein n=1 Tax=Anopheles sinensis TaxID=74873 RepID=A0A084WCR3_ANOSI|nr:hypothetical protein ZHAS_00016123 [Anopheles sinensis]